MSTQPQYEIVSAEGRAIQQLRAEIDSAVSTAQAYPRNVEKAFTDVQRFATSNPEIAAKCYYVLPGRMDKKTGRKGPDIVGPSIRLLEMFQGQWGNLQSGARVSSIDKVNSLVTIHAVAHDLEKNVRVEQEVTRRFYGSDDSLNNAINAASSIGIRNCLKRLIGPYVEVVFEQCREAVATGARSYGGKGTVDFREHVTKAVNAFAKMGVSVDQICAKLEVNGLDDIGAEQLATLRGIYTTITEGQATVEEVFDDAEPSTFDGRKADPPANPAMEAVQIATRLGWKPKQFEAWCGENWGNVFAKLNELDQQAALAELRALEEKAR